MKTVVQNLDDENQITCEDCGRKDKIGHAVVNHRGGAVRIVCHGCFLQKCTELLYPEKEVNGVH